MPTVNTPPDGGTTAQTPPTADEVEKTKAATPPAPAAAPATGTGRRAKARPAPSHYKVTSGGLTGADTVAYYRDAILTPEQVGDEARIAKLLNKGAIAPVEPDDHEPDA